MAIDQLTNGQTGLSVRTILNVLLRRHRYSGASDSQPNIVHGYDGNAVATNLHTCTIGGGGNANYENVIGGQEATVNTATSNLPLDETTTANYSIITGGYDNVANGQASVITGFHNLIAKLATHGSILGGSIHKILAGNYNTIAGGTNNQIVSGDGSVISGGSIHVITGENNVISGGKTNKITGTYSGIFGGYLNEIISGLYSSIFSGSNNKITGNQSIITGGINNTIVGGNCAIFGGSNNSVTDDSAYAFGSYASASVIGQVSYANGRFAALADAQFSDYHLRQTTTDAVAKGIGPSAATWGPLIPVSSSWYFKYIVVAKRHDTEGDMKSWTYEGMATRTAAGSASIVGTPTKTVIAATAGASTWDISIACVSGRIALSGTGETGATIYWSAKMETVQIIGQFQLNYGTLRTLLKIK